MQFTDRELFYTDRIWSSRSVRTVRSLKKISPSVYKSEITKSHLNKMQFTDRELFYTDRVCGSRSAQTVRTVRKISPLITRMKYSKSHKWVSIYGPWTLLYGPYLKFTVRTNCTDRQPFSTYVRGLYGPQETLRTETMVSRSVTGRVYWATLEETIRQRRTRTVNAHNYCTSRWSWTLNT